LESVRDELGKNIEKHRDRQRLETNYFKAKYNYHWKIWSE